MRYIKTFENLNENEPKVGDYVIIQQDAVLDPYKIWQIKEIIPKEHFRTSNPYNYTLRYERWENDRNWKQIQVSRDYIKYWSNNKEDLKNIIEIQKYNL